MIMSSINVKGLKLVKAEIGAEVEIEASHLFQSPDDMADVLERVSGL
jgi:hypothetical protein